MRSWRLNLVPTVKLGVSLMLACILAGFNATAFAKSLTAPAQANADSEVSIQLEGVDNPRDFISIVSAGSKEGHYEQYAYTTGNQVKLFAPLTPGEYEIRWLDAKSPYPTLTRQALKVMPVSAQLQVPATVAISAAIPVQWQGPDNPRDFITIVPVGSKETHYEGYLYTSKGSPLTLTAPTRPGDYEIRYLSGRGYKTLATAPISVTDTSASMNFASPARIGQALQVNWTGPANPREYITVVEAAAPEGRYGHYVYVTQGNPLTLMVPEQPGDYEIRYMTADSQRTLGSAPLQVVAVDASVQAQPSVVARQPLKVEWTGPDNPQDYIAITATGKPSSYISYSYTRRGNPVNVEAPRIPGEYEIHYLTGKTSQSLASRKLTVTAAADPGFLKVRLPEGTTQGMQYDAIEVVLDASGSMLQKLEGKRRIDIAKSTLAQLLDSLQPGQQQFALRVFGHRQADACDTELLLPPSPLQAASVKQTIAKLEAKNLARTPIADALSQVRQDLAGVKGNKLVILLTDGEETCAGDPAAAIKTLRESAINVRINIVGFAIDEYALKQQFSGWASMGGGAYFDAQNAAALASALSQSLQTPFTVLDGKGVVVASGAAGGNQLELPPGDYRIRSGAGEMPVQISAGATATVTLP